MSFVFDFNYANSITISYNNVVFFFGFTATFMAIFFNVIKMNAAQVCIIS